MLGRKLEERRIPASGSIALTERCNLRCKHCYLDPGNQISTELSTEKWLSIIDEITAAGCLDLLITGGEPLLRPDFPTIYGHAKYSGILTTVFTNGSLLTPEIVDIFSDLPPSEVEISLYGTSEKTYRKITGQSGVFERVRQGLDRMHEAGINFNLKTILMTENLDEFNSIRDFAGRYGVEFRFDAAIFPRMDGGKEPLGLRVDPQLAVDLELEDPKTAASWISHSENQQDYKPSDKLYKCGTGLTLFHVDSKGTLQPCILADRVTYSLLEGSFQKGWDEVIPRIREIRVDKSGECAQCGKQLLCGLCPAFFKLESGSEEIKSDYLCAMGHHRSKRIAAIQNNGGSGV
jgi:MoaA/NifB/PqqE/SkfB family radical SAM enzyme